MNSSIEQQNFPDPSSASAVFASDPTAEIDRPGSPYYADGVQVNYTAPSKWWNWLWNHISAWFADSKTDRAAMTTELTNVLTAASMTPDSSNSHQLSKAISVDAYSACRNYDTGHNVPYVVGNTLYIPVTELL